MSPKFVGLVYRVVFATRHTQKHIGHASHYGGKPVLKSGIVPLLEYAERYGKEI